MEENIVVEMAQSHDATQADVDVVLKRSFWVRKLGCACLQAIGVTQSVLVSHSGEVDLIAVGSKLEEHRQHWNQHEPLDAEHKRALLDARFADVGLKALEGRYEEALGICGRLINESAKGKEVLPGSLSLMTKIRAEGVMGLLHALMGDWQAAYDFFLRSIMQGAEQHCNSDGNEDFFHDYVVDSFEEALGYLLTDVVETNGSASGCFGSTEVVFEEQLDDSLEQLYNLGEEQFELGAYKKAAAMRHLHSNLTRDLEDKLTLRSHEVSYLYVAGDLEKAFEVNQVMYEASKQLDGSQWEFKCNLHMAVAGMFDQGNESDKDRAFKIREEVWSIVCAHTSTDPSFEFDGEDDGIAIGLFKLLQSYTSQGNWSAAKKLIDSMDAHIAKQFVNKPIWRKWQKGKHGAFKGMGDFESADEIVEDIPYMADDPLFELIRMEAITMHNYHSGKLQMALKQIEERLESILNLSPSMDYYEHVLSGRPQTLEGLIYSGTGRQQQN